jgi:hypothetical protein
MKIGVKTRDNPLVGFENGEIGHLLGYFEDKADFYEVIAEQRKGIDFFKKMKHLIYPCVVHAEHSVYGVNHADKSKHDLNSKSLDFARRVADVLNSDKIIVHTGIFSYPGKVEQGDPHINVENSFSFFRKVNDSRILAENLRRFSLGKQKDRSHLGYKPEPAGFYDFSCATPENVKEFMNETGVDFCFDFSHSVFSSTYYKKNYLDYISEFLELEPRHYHFSGQLIRTTKENPYHVEEIEEDHICLKESNLDLEKILRMTPKNAEITLETEPDFKKIQSDVMIARKLCP